MQIIELHADVMQSYFSQLKLKNGVRLLDSGRKTGFIGIIIGLQSVVKMYEEQVKNGKCIENAKYITITVKIIMIY